MTVRTILAALALMAMAPTAFAQDPVPAPPASVSATPAVTEAEVEAAGDAFTAKMEALSQELSTAVTAANGDIAKARADTDPIVARYQPDADAFASVLSAFIQTIPDSAEKAEMAAMVPVMEAQIKGAPAQIREEILAQPSAVPAPTAPAAPQ